MCKNLKIMLVILATVALAMCWALNSSFFELDEINISGNTNLNRDEVLRILNIESGQNILLMDFIAMSKKMRGENRIAEAKVNMHWPNGLNIYIKDEIGKYLLNVGDIWYLTSEGIVLPKSELDGIIDKPIIVPIESCNIHEQAKLEYESIVRSLEFLNYLSENNSSVLDIISEVMSPSEGEINLFLQNDGLRVRLGRNWDIFHKLELLLNNISCERERVEEIDFRFTDQAIVRYKNEASPSSRSEI